MTYRIVVCIKQVPEAGEAKIDPVTHNLVRESVPNILNPFDEFSIEEAVRIRERFGGTVTVITMGPPQAVGALNTAIQMGADRGILLTDIKLAGSDTLVTAMALSFIIRTLDFDMVICGLESTDSSTAQVGPELAELLNLPQITYANAIEFMDRSVKVTRETDSGYQIMSCDLPVLVTVVKGINTPREPDHETPMDGRIISVSLDDLSITKPGFSSDLSPTQVTAVEKSRMRKRAQLVIDSTLPAHERIRLIQQGGMNRRDDSTLLEGDTESMVKRLGDLMFQGIKVAGEGDENTR